MKRTLLTLFTGLFLLFSCGQPKQTEEPIKEVIERGLSLSREQAMAMAKKLENEEGRLPKSLKPDGTLETSDYAWWCSGFFPGVLWQLYDDSRLPEFKDMAEKYTARVEPAKTLTNTHDLGFMLFCSFGNGYLITGNPEYKEVLLTGAESLATRFNEKLGVIRSWDFNADKWQYPVIIDNMMNLELFQWAGNIDTNEGFLYIAQMHADKTMKHHYRPDFSSYHVVSYDLETGEPHIKQTHQGYADESAWARGQAWGLYGFIIMYRETIYLPYLYHAKNIAKYLMEHPRMPEDGIPYWDFDAPDIPNAPRDASAGAIMASALIELSRLDGTSFGKTCREFGEKQIRTLSSPEYLAQPGENGLFAIKHCVGHLPGNSEVDVPLSYADYYYVEALLRLKKLIQQ